MTRVEELKERFIVRWGSLQTRPFMAFSLSELITAAREEERERYAKTVTEWFALKACDPDPIVFNSSDLIKAIRAGEEEG